MVPGIDNTGKELFALSEEVPGDLERQPSPRSCHPCPGVKDTEEALHALSLVELCAVEHEQLDLEEVLFILRRRRIMTRVARVRHDKPSVVPMELSFRYSVLVEVWPRAGLFLRLEEEGVSE